MKKFSIYFLKVSFLGLLIILTSPSAMLEQEEDYEREFAQVIASASNPYGIKITPHTKEWVLQLKDLADKIHWIFYYDFDINGAGAKQVCTDKATASSVMEKAGIPCVHHELFVTPADKKYSPEGGTWNAIQKYALEVGYPVVCKPANESSGTGVEKASDQHELEALYLKRLGSGQYDFYVSPFVPMMEEFRVIMLDQELLLTYRKDRPHLTGDGETTIQGLLSKFIADKSPRVLSGVLSLKSIPQKDFEKVLAAGEQYPLQWMHNLSHGAQANTSISKEIREAVLPIAQQAMKALGIRFASVDVAWDQEKYQVLEVNSGVTLKRFMAQKGEAGKRLVTAIYEKAIAKMFDMEVVEDWGQRYGGALSDVLSQDR